LDGSSAQHYRGGQIALAPYNRRAALAAAQVLDGFDEEQFAAALAAPVGVSFGPDVVDTSEGLALLDLTIRLLSRLYPVIELRAPVSLDANLESLRTTALRINPLIEFGSASSGVVVGTQADSFPMSIYAGSDGWDALISDDVPRPIGSSDNILGAAAAACIAAGNLFRAVVLPMRLRQLDRDLRYSTFHLDRTQGHADEPPPLPAVRLDRTAIIGLGAIGNGLVWSLARSPVRGTVHLIDPEPIELSNLQRYVLATLEDAGTLKTTVASRELAGALKPIPHCQPLAAFVAEQGRGFERLAVGVDNRRDRIAAQATLPQTIFNAWTQPGDLGVSVHPHFGTAGACLSCLYMPDGQQPNEDELVARALGIPERVLQVRGLLATHGAPPQELLAAVAANRAIDPELLTPFERQPLRTLYVEGFCGGAVLPLGATGRPTQDMHVPLAHQSGLAGVLLAARLLRHAAGYGPLQTLISRFDVLHAAGFEMTQPRARVEGRRCLCNDADFLHAYHEKWPV
jgi:hypothetical protein